MTQTKWITVLGVIAAAAAAVSQIPEVEGAYKVIAVVIAAACGAACAYLAKGKSDTGKQ